MSNEAAWFKKAGSPLEIGPADMHKLNPDELLVKIQSVAIAPMEAGIQRTGMLIDEYPAILGADGAGIVQAVGSAVEGFAPGDRVIACFDGVPPYPKADYRRNSFQRFAVSLSALTCKIPSSLSFNDGVVLPLAASSTGDALFSDHGMNLIRPQGGKTASSNGKTIIVWGGSSSIGSVAIQMLVSAGYEVATVAGAKNQELCRSLGAKHVFDHSSPNVVDEIAAQFKGVDLAGVFSAIMSKEGMEKAIKLYQKLGSEGQLGSMMPPGMPAPCEVPGDVDIRRAHGSSIRNNDVGKLIWKDWLPTGLSAGTVMCSPQPLVAGKGLSKVQEAIDRYLEGVSGQKIVVEMD